MCRMLAARAPRGEDLRGLLLRFRKQASLSGTGPESERHHGDGWGLVAFGGFGEQLAMRRPTDASKDRAFEAAVDAIAGFQEPLVVVHFRNASVGSTRIENTHPFAHDGWWFAHNGTIKDASKLELRGVAYEGQTDSERYFRRLVRQLRSEPPADALRSTANQVSSMCDLSSLTCLLTNGTDLFAYRGLGGDLEDCGTQECQAEYYTLALARDGAATFIAQEPTHLNRPTDWTEIPIGAVVDWSHGQAPRIVAAKSVAVQPTRRTR